MEKHNESDSLDISSAMKLSPRVITDEQFAKFESYVAEIFGAFGMDLDTPATQETPKRFIKALFDSTEGYDGDDNIAKTFESECHTTSNCTISQIIQGPIPFHALCEHHVLPFYGKIYVGYIANEDIIGISKLTRIVRLFSKRFAVQERIGQEIANLLEELVHPEGIAVYIEAHHMCMEMRGVREANALTRTTVWRGIYEKESALRAEFFSSSGLNRYENR
ncbi:MAG: GTP cyclohydrolase I [Sphaerochaetaceae bacterium]